MKTWMLVIVILAVHSINGVVGQVLSEFDGSKLEEGSFSYDVTMKIGERSVDYTITRTISRTITKGEEVWSVVDQTRAPAGTLADTTYMDRSTLLPISRSASGPYFMQVSYSDTGAVGYMLFRGQKTMIDTTYDKSAVLASDANLRMAIASMSLNPEFMAGVTIFEEQPRRLVDYLLRVDSKKTLSINNKAIDTYLISLTSSDGKISGELHVLQNAPHYVVKSSFKRPTSNGTQIVTKTLTSMCIESREF